MSPKLTQPQNSTQMCRVLSLSSTFPLILWSQNYLSLVLFLGLIANMQYHWSSCTRWPVSDTIEYNCLLDTFFNIIPIFLELFPCPMNKYLMTLDWWHIFIVGIFGQTIDSLCSCSNDAMRQHPNLCQGWTRDIWICLGSLLHWEEFLLHLELWMENERKLIYYIYILWQCALCPNKLSLWQVFPSLISCFEGEVYELGD